MASEAPLPPTAVLGLGHLGAKVAERLVNEKFPVAVWNRSTEKAKYLGEMGAKVAQIPAEALSQSEIIILMLVDAAAIRQTLLSDESQKHLNKKTIVQMGTISAGESRELEATVTKLGARWVEAPVQGSKAEALAGTLQVMIGAETEPEPESAIGRVLAALGSVEYFGKVGAASTVKLAINHLLIAETAAFSASLGLVRANGVDVSRFMDTLRGSALYAKQFDKKLQKMMDRIHSNPNSTTRLFLKDLDLFVADAEAANLKADGAKSLHGVIQAAIDKGFGDTDYSAIYEGVNP
ncbi:3-hydroxyacid dehydrogenase [Klebsormidium nitens]|uniref:3-hydroxyacid dehydrogenase n=1 Tax=Klebsormidium nitens TaxID=105231 RepID=A0A1Y1HLU3_KLENI|nr:3-hydroxyacid dehydrogenase [Klebsormidium nitens]|eukprot:GAQ78139.1 3-hydroxyacid dehydrogenase [Klebsormidium nitens]